MLRNIFDLNDDEIVYLHGNCDEWVKENFKTGDIIMAILDYDLQTFGSGLTHCFIKRGDEYIDVRGNETDYYTFINEFESFKTSRRKVIEIVTLHEFEAYLEEWVILREASEN